MGLPIFYISGYYGPMEGRDTLSSGKESNVEVKININMGMDRSLRKFKRLCESYGVAREYKRRKHHSKPSVRRREKAESAEKRRQKALKKFKRDNIQRI